MTEPGPEAPADSRRRLSRPRSPSRWRSRSGGLVALAVLAAALVLIFELFRPPVIGLANNADFSNVMSFAGLEYSGEKPGEKFRDYIVTEFALVPPWAYPARYWTSEDLFAGAARLVAPLVCPPGRFDIRVIGGVHTLVLLLGIALLVAASGRASWAGGVATAILCVLLFTDVAYGAPFNSFYGQTASFLFLLLAAGVAAGGIARGGLSGSRLVLFFLAAMLFVVSKPQEAVQGPLFAVVGVALAAAAAGPTTGTAVNRDNRRPRRLALVLAAGLLAVSFTYFRAIPRGAIHNVGLYHSVFKDLLPFSPDPVRDLEDLGLDRSLVRYSGIHAYMPGAPLGDPAFQKQFFDRMGFGRLGVFYLRHPARFFDRVARAAPAASQMRPRLGNYSKESGFPPRTLATRFDGWSSLKQATRPVALPLFSVFVAATLTACAVGFRTAGPRERLFRIALAALVVLALTEFFVCAFADMLSDLPRHLYSFHAAVDLIWIADVAWIADRLSPRHTRRPVRAAA